MTACCPASTCGRLASARRGATCRSPPSPTAPCRSCSGGTTWATLRTASGVGGVRAGCARGRRVGGALPPHTPHSPPPPCPLPMLFPPLCPCTYADNAALMYSAIRETPWGERVKVVLMTGEGAPPRPRPPHTAAAAAAAAEFMLSPSLAHCASYVTFIRTSTDTAPHLTPTHTCCAAHCCCCCCRHAAVGHEPPPVAARDQPQRADLGRLHGTLAPGTGETAPRLLPPLPPPSPLPLLPLLPCKYVC